jgi:hypothetical protein
MSIDPARNPPPRAIGHVACVPLPCLRRGSFEPGRGPEGEEDPCWDIEADAERALLCRSCGAPITSSAATIDVNGSHEHTFFNPAGFRYEIGCFSRAPGCVNHGTPTSEFTWFSGFEWCYSSCGACGNHMGWRFSSTDSVFWGLILNQLERPS